MKEHFFQVTWVATYRTQNIQDRPPTYNVINSHVRTTIFAVENK